MQINNRPTGIISCGLQCVEKVFFDTLKTKRNTRRQGNRSDRRTKVRRGAVDAVSKNAFAQPFLRLCEILLLILFLAHVRLLFSAFLRCVGLSQSVGIYHFSDCCITSRFFQLKNPYISFTKNMQKLTATGIYAGSSSDARIHITISTRSFAAYPSA